MGEAAKASQKIGKEALTSLKNTLDEALDRAAQGGKISGMKMIGGFAIDNKNFLALFDRDPLLSIENQ